MRLREFLDSLVPLHIVYPNLCTLLVVAGIWEEVVVVLRLQTALGGLGVLPKPAGRTALIPDFEVMVVGLHGVRGVGHTVVSFLGWGFRFGGASGGSCGGRRLGS